MDELDPTKKLPLEQGQDGGISDHKLEVAVLSHMGNMAMESGLITTLPGGTEIFIRPGVKAVQAIFGCPDLAPGDYEVLPKAPDRRKG